jgi:hypothetical protein
MRNQQSEHPLAHALEGYALARQRASENRETIMALQKRYDQIGTAILESRQKAQETPSEDGLSVEEIIALAREQSATEATIGALEVALADANRKLQLAHRTAGHLLEMVFEMKNAVWIQLIRASIAAIPSDIRQAIQVALLNHPQLDEQFMRYFREKFLKIEADEIEAVKAYWGIIL